jgi:hypothetical protein
MKMPVFWIRWLHHVIASGKTLNSAAAEFKLGSDELRYARRLSQ